MEKTNNPQIFGIVKKIADIQTGSGKSGEYKSTTIEIEQIDKTSKPVYVSIWKEEIVQNLRANDTVIAHLDIAGREYNGKFYHNLVAYRVDVENPRDKSMHDVSKLKTRLGEPMKLASKFTPAQVTAAAPMANTQSESPFEENAAPVDDMPF